jgi:hypothetical protein
MQSGRENYAPLPLNGYEPYYAYLHMLCSLVIGRGIPPGRNVCNVEMPILPRLLLNECSFVAVETHSANTPSNISACYHLVLHSRA